MRYLATIALICVITTMGWAESPRSKQFAALVEPLIQTFCAECHSSDTDNEFPFVSPQPFDGISQDRGTWRKVATQLRQGTMPPPDHAQPETAARMLAADWIERYLRETACDGRPYAGVVTARRLNRREYANTVRDLVGVDLDLAQTLPVDSGGGEGFDNNGETLFLPPMLLERYLESAQQIVDAAIIAPPTRRLFLPKDMLPQQRQAAKSRTIPPGDEVAVLVPVAVSGRYRIPVGVVPLEEGELTIDLKVDGIVAASLTFRRYGEPGQANQEETTLRLTRGLHSISVRAPAKHAVEIVRLRVEQIPEAPTPAEIAAHRRLLGTKPGTIPVHPRAAARRFIEQFGSRAFRRPLSSHEELRFLQLYDRAAARGDSYEQRMKLAMKGILVSPEFLYRLETPPAGPELEALSDYELATRLSYFLWSTTPDAELTLLARSDSLRSREALHAQVDRMLADARSDAFFTQFVGQWLGTRDVGGRRAATENAIQNVYTPFVAADMRRQAVLLFQHVIKEDRSVLELLDADYTFLTGRLAKFYGMPNAEDLPKEEFQRVALADRRRGGMLGLGAVLALTSHISERETSPVLRGAWVLETLFGARIPPPPDEVPALNKQRRRKQQRTLRETLELHREDPQCAACHNLMDPIGFGLENFDFLGRWRDQDQGQPIDAAGVMPSGETFHGPEELKSVLLKRKRQFARQLVRKLLGYALGRSLVEADECTIEDLVTKLEQENYRGRALLNSVVLSLPFRYKCNSR